MSLKCIGLWHGSVAQMVIWMNITFFLSSLVCFLLGSVIDSGDTAASDTILILEALESSTGWKAMHSHTETQMPSDWGLPPLTETRGHTTHIGRIQLPWICSQSCPESLWGMGRMGGGGWPHHLLEV